MAKITLSTIKEAAEAKFGSYTIELEDGKEVTLLHVLRLSDEARAEMLSLSGGEDEEKESTEAEQLEKIARIAELATETPAQYARLVEAVSPRGYIDQALLTEIVMGYMEGQKAGEASPSRD